MKGKNFQKGRGAQINLKNRYEKFEYNIEREYKEHLYLNEEDTTGASHTKYIKVYPKTILNKILSPDVGSAYSLNPYQGCEHGCVYCYARNSHEYWGYSAGTDFEKNILIKQNAVQLLEQVFQKKNYKPLPIMLSGNTDCYQPAERKFKLTQKILNLCLKYQHPVGIITKNSLIGRDLGLLQELAVNQLVHVNLSVNSLNESLRRTMEPRTASHKQQLKTIELFSNHKIPVSVMIAPIVPGLNSHEILKVAKNVSEAGALDINYTLVRLNGQIAEIFSHWLNLNYQDRADKVLKLIRDCHAGKLNDSEFGRRMRGSGPQAIQIHQLIKLAKRKYFPNKQKAVLRNDLFIKAPKGQLGFL